MLVYHPAFDIYHAVRRFLKLLRLSDGQVFSVEHFKLIDYFVVFPSETFKIRLPMQYADFRKKIKVNKYEAVNNGRIVFQQLQGYQDAALQCLAAYAFIDPLQYKKGEVQLNDTVMSAELNALLENTLESATLLDFMNEVLLRMPYEGPIGLKERSNLF